MAKRKQPTANKGSGGLIDTVRQVVGQYMAEKLGTGQSGPVKSTVFIADPDGSLRRGEYTTPTLGPKPQQSKGNPFTRQIISQDVANDLRGKFQNVRNTYGNVTRLGVLSDVASRGGLRGGLAEGEMVQMGIDAASTGANSRVVRSLTASVSQALGRDSRFGLRILQGLGRGLKMGGAVAAIAQTGFAVAGEYFEQRQASARAQLKSFNAAAEGNFEASFARNSREGIRKSVMNSRGVMQQLSDEFGFTEDTENQIAERAVKTLNTLNKARGTAERMGINVNAVLANYAKKKGVSILSLTPAEKNEALDPVIKAAVEARVPESAVDSEMAAKGIKAAVPTSVNLAMASGGGGMGLYNFQAKNDTRDAAYVEARRDEIRENIQSTVVTELAGRDAIERKSVQKVMAQRTPEERRTIERDVRESQYKLSAARDRHKMDWKD